METMRRQNEDVIPKAWIIFVRDELYSNLSKDDYRNEYSWQHGS